MNVLKEYATVDGHIIASIQEDDKHIGFTVVDRNIQRKCEQNFNTASVAIEWALSNDWSLFDESN